MKSSSNRDDEPGDLYPPSDWFETPHEPAAATIVDQPQRVIVEHHHYTHYPAAADPRPEQGSGWRRVWAMMTPKLWLPAIGLAWALFAGGFVLSMTPLSILGIIMGWVSIPLMLAAAGLFACRWFVAVLSWKLAVASARLILISCAALALFGLAAAPFLLLGS